MSLKHEVNEMIAGKLPVKGNRLKNGIVASGQTASSDGTNCRLPELRAGENASPGSRGKANPQPPFYDTVRLL